MKGTIWTLKDCPFEVDTCVTLYRVFETIIVITRRTHKHRRHVIGLVIFYIGTNKHYIVTSLNDLTFSSRLADH